MKIQKAFKRLEFHIWTCILFTKSDIKTMLIPILAHAAASAPFASWDRVLPTAFWIWIQVLNNALANQTLDPDEDKINKPSRPIPSGRISLEAALALRFLMPLVSLTWSATHSKEILMANIVWAAIVFAYNEGGFAGGHWAGRNLCIGLGMAALEFGACILAGGSYRSVDSGCLLATVCSGFICATTYHAGDFKDIEGDRIVKRNTIPLAFPRSSRPTLAALLVAWSVALSFLWALPHTLAALFIMLASYVGWRFVTRIGKREDQLSCVWYYAWLSVAHALPLC